jgi:hypothetical protein
MGDGMAPRALVLNGSADVKKHVGQKVTVAGSRSAGSPNTLRTDLETLNVSSLKVVAKSCS